MSASSKLSSTLKTLAVVWIMLVGFFTALLVAPEVVTTPVAATSSAFHLTAAAQDGQLTKKTWIPGGSTATSVVWGSGIHSGYDSTKYLNGSVCADVYRTFLRFDTSAIPTAATIDIAVLQVRLLTISDSGHSYSDMALRVYSSDWYANAALTSADWNSQLTFQNTIASLGSGQPSWISASMNTNTIAKGAGAWTQFSLKANWEYPRPYSDLGLREGHWNMQDYDTDPVVSAYLMITYRLAGYTIVIRDTLLRYYNSTLFPDVAEWNLTHDLYTFSFSTPPNMWKIGAFNPYVTIYKGASSWAWVGIVPNVGDIVETATYLTLISDSIPIVQNSTLYRVWFTVPKDQPFTNVHLSLYNQFTGIGFVWGELAAQICDGTTWDNTTASVITSPDFSVDPDAIYTIRIFDFFGNSLNDFTFVSNAIDESVSIAIPVYSWQLMNGNDQAVLVSMKWNNSGSAFEFFVAPRWASEHLIKSGNYSIGVTFYNSSGYATGTLNFNQSVPMAGLNASYLTVNGTTISQIVTDLAGMNATVQVIATLFSPRAWIAFYNAFTAEGILWGVMQVQICNGSSWNPATARVITSPSFQAVVNSNYTLRAYDFFGNVLVQHPFNVTTQDAYVNVPVPVYSWQVFNQNAQAVLVRILWNHSGTPFEFFVAPGFPIERFLKGGNYSFFVTFYSSQGIAGSTVFYNRTLPMPGLNASFIFVNGTTLSEIISAVNGVQAVQTILVSLLTPGVLWTGLNVPTIPGYIMGGITNADIFNNRFVVSAQTTETHAGFWLNYSDPVPATAITSTIIADDWRFLGNLSTHLFINQTNTSTLVYTATTLPATVSTNGLALSSWTNRTVSATREMSIRFSQAFTYQYRPDLRQYETNILLHNSPTSTQLRNVSLFVPFMNSSLVNNESVVVYDQNLTLVLLEGTNYVQTWTGLYLYWPLFNVSTWKGLRISYTNVNDSEFSKVASVVVLQLGDGSTFTRVWQSDTFFYCDASWTNSWRQTYTGPLYITLKLSVSVDPTTVIVLDGANNVVLNVIVNGNTVIIPDLNIAVGETVTYTILFQSEKGSIMSLSYAGIPFFVVAMSVMIGALVMGGAFTLMGTKDGRMRQLGRVCFGLSALALGLLSVLVIYAIVMTGA